MNFDENIMSITRIISEKTKALHQNLRLFVGKKFVIEKIIRNNLPYPKTEEYLNSASRRLSELFTKGLILVLGKSRNNLQVIVTPEDICLVALILTTTPVLFILVNSGSWLWILESYACLLMPALVSFCFS